MLAAATPLVLPRSGLTATALLGVAVLVCSLVAAVVAGPRPLLLGLAGLGLVASVVGSYPGATTHQRDLAILLTSATLPLCAAALVRDRWSTALLVGGAVLAGPLRALVYEPFLDPGCPACPRGGLVLRPMPDLATALFVLGTGLALLVMAWAVRTGVLAIVPILGLAVLTAFDIAVGPALVAGCLITAAVLGRQVITTYTRHTQLDRLVRHLEAGGEADVGGLGELAEASDPAARLVLHNLQLTHDLTSRLEAVTAARAGVVRVAETERRALERDLHDGVQQQLLALGFDLRLAMAGREDDAHLASALAETTDALEDVRQITHGVYPPLLATRGLGAAAAHLVRRSVSAATLEVPDERLDPTVERAVFAVLADAIERGADAVSVRLVNVLRVDADGVTSYDTHLRDVVGALGGTITAEGTRVSAVIPCV